MNMKKTFMEPDMRVIVLNLNENIATSSRTETYYNTVTFNINADNTVQETGVFWSEVTSTPVQQADDLDVAYYLILGLKARFGSDKDFEGCRVWS